MMEEDVVHRMLHQLYRIACDLKYYSNKMYVAYTLYKSAKDSEEVLYYRSIIEDYLKRALDKAYDATEVVRSIMDILLKVREK